MDCTSWETVRFQATHPREVGRCCTTASRLEVDASPKPGNVHRYSDPRQHGKSREQFLAAIDALAPHYEGAARVGYEAGRAGREIDSNLHIGPVLLDATRSMVAAQSAGNLLLGHVLLLVPVAVAGGYLVALLEREPRDVTRGSFKEFKATVQAVTNSGSTSDVIMLYEAIRAANPGGMGRVVQFDVNAPGFRDELARHQATFHDVFSTNPDIDSISSEWITGFELTFSTTFPRLNGLVGDGMPVNDAIVQLFVETLAGRPDSLIIRKRGIESARAVSRQAKDVVERGGMFSDAGKQQVTLLDERLAGSGGTLNPGTTADLCAAAITLWLLSGATVE